MRTQWGGTRLMTCLLALAGAVAWAADPPAAAPPLPTTPPGATPPDFAVKQAPDKRSFLERLLAEVPPLKHPRGQRWPMIMWESLPTTVQPAAAYQALLDRGLTQCLRLDAKLLPVAGALQAAGSPIIIVEGRGGAWPANLAGKAENWAHQFEDGYTLPKGRPAAACLVREDGWALNVANLQTTLRAFKAANVRIDAAWLDWEGDPYWPGGQYEQAKHCRQCQAELPPGTLATPEAFAAFGWRLYVRLLDTYLAAPILAEFPRCSITNWNVVVSTPERPLRFWENTVISPTFPSVMTATNPIAYGNTVFFKRAWKPEYVFDREHVDQFYAHLLLRMVSDDTANRLKYMPEKQSVPWVDRWCPDDEDPKIPIISRERYREVLRHLWLRGVAAMQIFNPRRPGFDDIVFSEVADAVAVYDEMLAFAPFLDRGEVLCTDVPQVQDDGVLWSGLRLGDEAVVRVFKQGGGTAEVTIAAWPGAPVKLTADAKGRTFLLKRTGDAAKAEAK